MDSVFKTLNIKQCTFVSLIIFEFSTFNKEYIKKHNHATIFGSISMDPTDNCLM